MANNNHAELVATGKPNIEGAIFCAPMGTKVPTDAVSALDAAFKCLGYCSEDGMTNTQSISSGSFKAWGGQTVHNYEDGFSDAFKFKLIEILSVETLKVVYGEKNVTGDLESGIHVKVNGLPHENRVWVVDMVHNNYVKRIVVPCAKITALGDIVYRDNTVAGFETTLSATPDSEGNFHHEYISKPAA